jgi:alkylhydroperoxidase/carboxymuconolactone decarboxylase family protein YurZ
MQDPLHAAFELAAAVHRGAAEATRQAALRVETELGTGTARELLRLLHLFFGVPKIVQALNACIEVLPPLATQAAQPCDAAQGELNFRKLYADEADRVLDHLASLDPTLRTWILNHAYARALLRDGLSLAQTERLAVLCLAATGCWKQWESHVAIAGRQGVTIATMQADCAAAQAWLGAEASKRAQAELTGRKA